MAGRPRRRARLRRERRSRHTRWNPSESLLTLGGFLKGHFGLLVKAARSAAYPATAERVEDLANNMALALAQGSRLSPEQQDPLSSWKKKALQLARLLRDRSYGPPPQTGRGRRQREDKPLIFGFQTDAEREQDLGWYIRKTKEWESPGERADVAYEPIEGDEIARHSGYVASSAEQTPDASEIIYRKHLIELLWHFFDQLSEIERRIIFLHFFRLFGAVVDQGIGAAEVLQEKAGDLEDAAARRERRGQGQYALELRASAVRLEERAARLLQDVDRRNREIDQAVADLTARLRNADRPEIPQIRGVGYPIDQIAKAYPSFPRNRVKALTARVAEMIEEVLFSQAESNPRFPLGGPSRFWGRRGYGRSSW